MPASARSSSSSASRTPAARARRSARCWSATRDDASCAAALRGQSRHGLRRAHAARAAREPAAARAPHAARRASFGARRRRAACTGSSRSSSRRSPTRSGRATGACGTRSSSACARTRPPPRSSRSARRRRPNAPRPRRHCRDATPASAACGSRIPTRSCSRIPASRSASSPTIGRQSPRSRCRCSSSGR